jgi:hypothetical protein
MFKQHILCFALTYAVSARESFLSKMQATTISHENHGEMNPEHIGTATTLGGDIVRPTNTVVGAL